jgi:hypothetical protein
VITVTASKLLQTSEVRQRRSLVNSKKMPDDKNLLYKAKAGIVPAPTDCTGMGEQPVFLDDFCRLLT